MSHSVRLLTRLGIAIEKIGQHVSQIGRRAQVHAQSGADVRFGGTAELIDHASKANAHYPVDLKALGDEVNEHGRLPVVVSFNGPGANVHLSGLSAHLKNLPLQNQRQSFAGNNLELLNRQYSAAQLRNFPRKESSGGDK